MSDAKNIRIGLKEYPIRFDLNVVELVQKRFEDVANLPQKLQEISELKWLLTELINEGIDFEFYMSGTKKDHVTEREVGMLLGYKDLSRKDLTETILNAFNDCMTDEKNV